GCWHPLFDPSHRSSVHGLPSSVHEVPLAFFASAGHVALEPVQVSATSHSPEADRQVVLDDLNASVGQALLLPSHVSATSQSPAVDRHTIPAGSFASAGHAAAAPVQKSALSQAP